MGRGGHFHECSTSAECQVVHCMGTGQHGAAAQKVLCKSGRKEAVFAQGPGPTSSPRFWFCMAVALGKQGWALQTQGRGNLRDSANDTVMALLKHMHAAKTHAAPTCTTSDSTMGAASWPCAGESPNSSTRLSS